MNYPEDTWRPPQAARRWADACARILAIGLADCLFAAANSDWRGPAAQLTAGGFAFAACWFALYAHRSRITLTGDAVIVVNALSAPRTIALAEITDISEGPLGLKIHHARRIPTRAQAAVTPRAAILAGRPTRSTHIATRILDASGHREQTR